MTRYAALIRGIMPMNPNMRNEKLRAVFEVLGFSNVQTVISSGNVLFESNARNISKLEKDIEEGLFENLGFRSAVFVRSKNELESIIKSNPFKGAIHGPKSYLVVTFTKKNGKKIPAEIFSTINIAANRTPDFMARIEKQYGKEITSRTWKTLEKLVQKMNASTARK